MSSVFSRPGDTTQPDAPQQYLTFTLADEVFAVGTRSVREIIEYGHLTPVPMMPSCVLGVINLRGGVVPIMDLRQRLGAGHTAISRRSCIVILEVERDDLRQVMGILVEAVNAVVEIAAQDIEPAPRFGARIRTDFIRGMAKLDGRLVVLLDIGQVLSLDDLQRLAEVGTTADLQQSA
ncbi:chemotaxis protein CheW [Pseudomonas sp. No.21]|jgi:purine-binding chemotaxis protein CheW|uniref:chemotaxis protein CheW n=1 Tax=Pseudomonas TaxID=286 RepID=UPI000DA90DAA|nr:MULTISPECIES: chemotaxis protein CheW [Pseudomonas]MDW3715438.1 chemotaxis protein CheW [Pseudomonas sp. 2023EL-01195]PZE10011.1 chemotaxis protein CheW [Pseudomonas sp. 57B-090624]GJN45561.1 chemotaxis protein CheW [Pseudomonas tohonis]